jgi:outer membrane biosynthesis protein TonB
MALIFTSDDKKLSLGMKIALGFSVFLHLGVLIGGMVGLPYLSKPLVLPPQAIAVEIVDISELTTTDKKPSFAAIKPKEKKEPPKKEEKKVKAPPKVEAKEPPKIKPLDKPPEKKKDTVKPKAKTPLPPSENLEKPKLPEPKKEKPKEEAVEQEDPLLSLMKNLQDSEDSAETDNPDNGAQEKAPDAPIAEYVTANELNALTNQLVSCWQIPIGAKNVHDMVVKIRIWANADRTVKRVEIEDQWRLSNDPAFRALAESAKRAVLDPYCSPLDIPEEKYNVWKDQYIVVPFDPSRVT